MARFRTATEADVEAILEIMRGYYEEDGYAFVEAEARAAVLDLIQDDRLGRLWVAQDGGRVAGYAAITLGFSLEYRGRDAFLDELFISEASRGHGLGREALEIAEAHCRQLGVKALHLEVERHRKPALELYRQAGFKDHDRYLMTKALK
jgi:GNAT superfamily N-acetyltransferase